MSNQEAKGKVKKIAGEMKQATGIVTGNRKLEREGASQRVAGAAQEGLGKARRKTGELVEKVADAIKE